MHYTKTVESYGRQETKIDLERFVADLAKELGGKVQRDPDRDHGDQTHIVLGTERLDFYANNYGSKGRVRVSIWAPDIKHDERGHLQRQGKDRDRDLRPPTSGPSRRSPRTSKGGLWMAPRRPCDCSESMPILCARGGLTSRNTLNSCARPPGSTSR